MSLSAPPLSSTVLLPSLSVAVLTTPASSPAFFVKAPDSHEAWKLKGDLLLYSKTHIDEALAAYRKAVELKPDFVPAFCPTACVESRPPEKYRWAQSAGSGRF